MQVTPPVDTLVGAKGLMPRKMRIKKASQREKLNLF
jgi:hypothetical protein